MLHYFAWPCTNGTWVPVYQHPLRERELVIVLDCNTQDAACAEANRLNQLARQRKRQIEAERQEVGIRRTPRGFYADNE